MKVNVMVTGCFMLTAALLATGSLWAQPDSSEAPPPPAQDRFEGGARPMRLDPAEFDADKDGFVSAQEYVDGNDKLMKGRFQQLDSNDDGNLSREEFERPFNQGNRPRGRAMGRGDGANPPPPPPDREAQGQRPSDREPRRSYSPGRRSFPTFEEYDTNKDDLISEEEFLKVHQQASRERFKELDTEDAGKLSIEQLRAARASMGGPRGPRGPRGGPDQRRGESGQRRSESD
ncbi:MAG: EF-hand domain-containing protein [Candidatus Hydrogenedentales bacterium]|jgi:Ca2+-binding EF-hand superfamily protein